MSFQRAVVWTDHQHAVVIRFNADTSETQRLHAHPHPTGQHGSAVRTEHEFFAAVCGALQEGTQTLVTGGHTALADLRHFVTRHQPQVAARIAGYEVVDHPSDRQLLAVARTFFDRLERLAQPAQKV